jgi:hypothetical protein
VTQDFGFDGLGDAEKVKFCEAEVAATLGKLDEMIAHWLRCAPRWKTLMGSVHPRR